MVEIGAGREPGVEIRAVASVASPSWISAVVVDSRSSRLCRGTIGQKRLASGRWLLDTFIALTSSSTNQVAAAAASANVAIRAQGGKNG